MHQHILVRENGQIQIGANLGTLGLAIVLLILVLFVVDLFSCAGAPSSISTPVEVRRIPLPDGGAVIFFNTTATYTTPLSVTVTRELEIAEDSDIYQAQIGAVNVTIQSGSAQGTTQFSLVCRPGRFFSDLSGNKGSTDFENEFEVFAEFDFIFLPNVQSDNATVSCREVG
ncbi:MAG: hypothetical protein MN733_25165 [Nitrososphaera sp.]|nr:hypothetical protein [Nitrososphaera sp.]